MRRLPVAVATVLLLAPGTADLQGPPQGSRPAPPGAPVVGHTIPRGTDPTAPVPYVVRPADGTLPWPHHAPHFTQAEYDGMMGDLFIINNFALYQGGSTRESVYLHSGIDVVAPNGTPIYSLASGTVRAISGSAPYYLTVLIEDADRPGWAWSYSHITPAPHAQVGTFVPAGQVIGRINFQGLDHLHLSRTFLKPGGSWGSFVSLANVDPMPYFDYRDTEPPIIEPGFYYFLNESHAMFPRGQPTLVSGEVDIVAGVRDAGEYARGRLPRSSSPVIYGNQNAPQRLHVSIAAADDPGRPLWSQAALDLSAVIVDRRPGASATLGDPDRVETVYAFRPAIRPVLDVTALFSYYFLTNRSRAGEPTMIEAHDGEPSWDTAAVDASGRRLFPDGEYIVTVRAWDAKGNMAITHDRAAVLNR
jgi:hypothetical protein